MTHDAQVIDVAFDLAELGAQRVDLVAIAEGDHPALQRPLKHDVDPAGNHREIVKTANLIMGIFRQHRLRVEERDRIDHLAYQLPAKLTGRLAQPQQLARRLVDDFNPPLIVNGNYAFINRLHQRLLLAHQQADLARLEGEDLLLNTAGKEPGEDKESNQQQHRGNQDIDHFTDGNGVQVAGEIADRNNADHLSGSVEDGGLTAQRNTQPAFADGGGAFTLQYGFVVTAYQRGAHSVGEDGVKKMLALIITNHNKAGVTVRRNLLHKIMDGDDILLFNFMSQCRNKRNLFSLYFGARAHFLIKLFPDIGIIISAQ